MEETKALAEVVKLAHAQAETAQEKLLQIYSVACLVGEFNSITTKADPPTFCSHDVIYTMVLFANQLRDVADDLAGLIGDLRRAGQQEQLAEVK